MHEYIRRGATYIEKIETHLDSMAGQAVADFPAETDFNDVEDILRPRRWVCFSTMAS
jgi:hypothetical protein